MDINTFTKTFFGELHSNQLKIIKAGNDSIILATNACITSDDGNVAHSANCNCDEEYEEWKANEEEVLTGGGDDY